MKIEVSIPKSLIQENLDVFLTIYLRGFVSGSKKFKESDITCEKEDNHVECYVTVNAKPEDNLHSGFIYNEETKRWIALDYLDNDYKFPITLEIVYYKNYATITAKA